MIGDWRLVGELLFYDRVFLIVLLVCNGYRRNKKTSLLKIWQIPPQSQKTDTSKAQKVMIMYIISTLLLKISQNFLCVQHKKTPSIALFFVFFHNIHVLIWRWILCYSNKKTLKNCKNTQKKYRILVYNTSVYMNTIQLYKYTSI